MDLLLPAISADLGGTGAVSASPSSLLPTEGGATLSAICAPEIKPSPLLLDFADVAEIECVGVAVFIGDPPDLVPLRACSIFVTDPITEPSFVLTSVPAGAAADVLLCTDTGEVTGVGFVAAGVD